MVNVPENIAGNVSGALWRIILKYILWYSCFSHFTVGSNKTRQITIRGLGLNTTNNDMRHIVISADEHLPAGAENLWTTWKAHNRQESTCWSGDFLTNKKHVTVSSGRQCNTYWSDPWRTLSALPQDITTANDIAIGYGRHREVTIWPTYDSWWKDKNDDESG